ncbi:hypothetical protein ACGFX4_16005 [Kitasatospora sp. NPDC048365]|uniref:hypothetical protein n=1 Tax=Kitasatospora sp. NPDC048365 TaxID=3364050 RepID=UPI0037114B87
MLTAYRHDTVSCSIGDCLATEVSTPDLVVHDDEGDRYEETRTWRRSMWAKGWRWVGNRASCPSCPPLVVESLQGRHLPGPAPRTVPAPAVEGA